MSKATGETTGIASDKTTSEAIGKLMLITSKRKIKDYDDGSFDHST